MWVLSLATVTLQMCHPVEESDLIRLLPWQHHHSSNNKGTIATYWSYNHDNLLTINTKVSCEYKSMFGSHDDDDVIIMVHIIVHYWYKGK